jgi:DNA recombination protein RmuC
MSASLLITIVGLMLVVMIITVIIGFVIGRRSANNGDSATTIKTLEEQLALTTKTLEAERREAQSLRSERDIEHTKRIALQEQLQQRDIEHEAHLANIKEETKASHEAQIASLKEAHTLQLKQLSESFNQQMEQIKEMNKRQVEDQLSLIREQMLTTSETVLKARQQELEQRNIEEVSKIVDPLNHSLKMMQEALNNSNKEHNETMTRLDATIQANMRNSRDLGETAERLTRALVGEVKVQGNFGELKLRQLLEDLGLRDGEQYSTQQSLKDRFGASIKDDAEKNLIPDFVLHFPNNRDVIVDSKVNLKAYEAYINADTSMDGGEDAEAKSRYCREHIAGVRRQVDLLAKKDYTKYLDSKYAKLNFVIMYMHNEGALNLALMNDSGLWKYAYDKGVLILGPQTMYMNLRILELMWTQSRQLGNQQNIVKAAEEMIKRTQVFAERFNEVEKCLKKTYDAVNDVKKSTANGGQSIITSAKKIISLGVKEDNSHAKISSLYIDEDATQMIGELEENCESTHQMSAIPDGEDEVIEKKYKK